MNLDFLPKDYGQQINMLHSFIIGPLLLWTGYKLNFGNELHYLEKLMLLITGIIVVGYHGYKTIKHHLDGDSIATDYGFQINVLHFLFIGPLIAWSGYKLYNGKTPTDLEKTVLLLLGVIATVYHTYKQLFNQ